MEESNGNIDTWKYWIMVGWMDLIKKSMDYGQTIPEHLVQEGYEEYVRKLEVFKIKELKTLTGVKPNLNPAAVQEAYKQMLKSGKHPMLAKELKDQSGIKPELDEDLVQKCFEAYVMTANYADVECMISLIGKKPDVPEEVVQKGYNMAIALGSPLSVYRLKGIFKVEPVFDEKSVQEGYKSCVKYKTLNAFSHIQIATKIKASKHTIKKAYEEWLDKGYLSYCKTLKELTGELPPQEGLEKAKKKFAQFGWESYAEQLKELAES